MGLLSCAACFMLINLLFTAVPAASAAAEQSKPGEIGETVYIIRAEQTIESGLQRFLERAYAEAENAKAERVLLIINTLGGRVDSAEEIGHMIRTSKVPTTAFVQGKAVSAGTYIALNAQQLVMEPGSTIGSAAVVDATGTLITNPKTVSYWTEEMKEAARLGGRDPNIAAAMVNPDITLELKELGRTKQKGDILALSATDALKVGYADFTASSVDEVLNHLGISQPSVVEVKPTAVERIAQFLTQPLVMTLLLIIGIAGVAIELVVPGFGAPGIIGIAAFGLYFFGHVIAGFAGMEEVILFVLGIVLLIIELFVPSFGILGILGSASLIAGVVLAAPDPKSALVSLAVALVAAGTIVFFVAKRFQHRGIWNRFILRDSLTTAEGYVSTADKASYLGQKGRSITPLRPAGTARIGTERVDVVTSGEFIGADVAVEVIKVEGTRVVVQQWNETTLK
ncbi:nodulation protein NfeD [Paenibacillus sp. sptzw28]|nr:nodulation protein NfeD [Paenibacillus sp. sptzw28]